MANNVKFSTGLQDDLLKRNSDNSYVHKIENGHVYFATRENDEGETIGSIFYDVNGKRVSMGGGVAEQAKADDMKQNIADTYVTRISSEGAKYASTDGVTLTTYNGRNAVLDTILLPVAGTDRAGVVITGAQTFAGNKTFTGIIHLTNTRDAESGSDSGVLIIGNKDGSHLIFDDNEIMAKNKTDGTSVLYLNADGGAVYTGGNFIPNGTTKTLSIGSAAAYWKEAYIGNVVTDTLSGHLTGSLTGNVTGNVTGHASLDLPLAGGTMTGDISFATIASWPTASGETYPIKSKGLKWSGSSDNASIYYVVEASDKGALYLDMGDDAGTAIKFAMGGTAHTVFESNGNIYPVTTNKGSLGTSSNKFASVYATNFYGIIDKAYGDESGNNIQASYGAKLQAHTHDGSGWSFRLLNKNGGALADTLTVPEATETLAGLMTVNAQTFAGNKTFRGDITIQHATVDTMTNSSANPYLKFLNSDGSQGAMIMFTDYDSYRAPGGLKILGVGASTPAWLEVEGDLVVGGATALNGNLTLKGNLLPHADNTYTLGDNNYKWKELHTTTAYINEAIHVNRGADGSKGGIGLYSTSAPSDYGIAMRSNLGQYGYATDTWNTYFSMVGGAARGWIFRNGGTAIASINGQGKMTLAHSLQSPSVGKESYIAYPKDGTYICNTSSITGYLKITLPQSWTSTMMRFKVSIYNYVTGTSVEYLIGGYNYSSGSTWEHQAFAQCIGKWEHPELSNLTVRFGHDGSKCAIYIGESATKWSYPQVVISDIVVGYSNYEHSKWYEGWIPSFTTTLGTITKTIKNTNIAYRAYHADRATADESGSNIKANYLARIRQVTSDKDTFTFRGVNKNGSDMNDLITIPAATASGTDNTKWKAGLVTSQAQQWAGTKTFRDNIVISHATTSTVAAGATNPHIRFEEYEGVQPVYLMYNDHDVYRSPAGLKVVGDSSKSSSKAWFEVEGDLIIGANSTLNGNVSIKGNIMPQADNSYVIGDLNAKWADVYSQNMHVYRTLYVNTSTTGSEGGIALHGTVPPTDYGITMRSNLGAHGYATDTWNTYFSMTNGATRGWVFRNGGTNVASINGQGYAHLNKLCLNRQGNTAYGRIGWYNKDFYTWYDYMSDSTAGAAPTGGKPSQMGSVTTWARRSLIENISNYGWVWESTNNAAASSTSAQPTPRMALASDTGRLYLSNDLMLMMGDTDKFVHYLYATGAGATNYVGASWRAGVLGSGSSNTNYYVIQSGTSSTANTTWENAVRIGQNNYDFTVGTTTKGGIGVANTSSTTGNGISLYNGAMPNSDGTAKSGKPTYGLFFGGTGTFGKHGYVQGDWATYFTMDSTANRGWVFLKGDTAVASINNDGKAQFNETYITGPLKIGNNANGDTNYIMFYGTTGDNPGSFNHAYIGENLYGSSESSELLLFKGNDPATVSGVSGTGADRIRHIAAAHVFQTYASALSGTWTTICDSTVPVTKFEILQSGVAVTGNAAISGNTTIGGTLGVTGATTLSSTLDVTGITKLKYGSAATAINTGALQVTGGLSTTAASYMNGALTVNSTINATGNITAPRFIGLADRATFIDATMSGTSSATHLTAHPAVAGRVAFYYNVNPCTGLFAADNNANFLITLNKHSGNYDSQLGFSSNGNIYYRSFNGSALNNTTGWQMLLTTSNVFGELDGRYVNVTGDTMAGHLNALNGLSWNHAYWSPAGNIYCQPTANSQEWSIDVGSGSYTGSYFHVWSARNGASMLRCYADNNAVDVPSGPFTVSGGNSYFTKTIVCSAQVGNFGEGIRLNCNDGQWSTITMGSTGDTGTRDNCWSIHRKADNNFCISRASSDGSNGLVMTRTGMGLGTISPEARLHVVGNFYVNNGHARFYTPDAGTSPGAAAVEIREVGLASSGGTHSVAYAPRLGFHWGNRYWGQIAFFNSEFQFRSSDVNSYCPARASAFWGAVWNDYAEYRKAETLEAGRVVIEDESGEMKLSTERLQPGANVVSDTFGFAIGETDDCKTPLAVAGRVLAYPYEDRNSYPLGAAVCSGPNGTISLMTREEIREYPERIIGTVSEIPTYEVWGDGNAPINGRIWIKVR